MKEITMPKLSDTMTEGSVVLWRKAVGAQVQRGEVIAEVETDKATMELEAFASGTLLEIRVEAGTTVPVGTVIGLIGEEGERPIARDVVQAKVPTEPAPETETKAEFPPLEAVSPGSADDVFAAPVVRRRARELGIDLNALIGSGPGGRILLADLKPAATEAERETLWKGEAEKAKARPDEKLDRAAMKDAQRATPETTQGLSRMRMAIARTVSESWRTIPHFSVTVEVRMDTAERFRDRLKEDGSDVSITALLIKATAQALTGFPRLNASLQEAQLVVHPEVNIGVVVRRDDGLLVPVLRDCANLSLAETAQRASQLVERARNGQLSHTELSGGTFAISNLGMYQIHSFVALILPPMAAVLAVGAVRDGVIAEAGQPIVARLLSLTLSADHRVVDGVYAAEFLQELKLLLETPERLAGSRKFV